MAGQDENGGEQTPETPKACPNEKQMNLLAIMMQNMKGKPEFDWEKIAAEAGYKNVHTVRSTYSQMCRKFGWDNVSGASKTPKDGAAAVSGGPDTPTKVSKRTGKVGGRGRKAKAAAAAADPADDDDDDHKLKAEASDDVDAPPHDGSLSGEELHS